jgi:predicted transglutaminase-like cysteine proteinase
MSHKTCLAIILGLLIIAAYFYIDANSVHTSYDDLKESSKSLLEERQAALFDQSLLLPSGLDQHYERIRNYVGPRFTSKGDQGWLTFYVTQVLHDLGNYTYDELCSELVNATGNSCKNETTEFMENFFQYLKQSNVLASFSSSNATEIQLVYDWVNTFVEYGNDTGGFGRFPIETLTTRFGDCEDQAMALSFLLESKGYETALCLLHDKNLTQYGPDGLYHTFCVVRKDNLDYNGTLITLKEYPDYGCTWIVLDPAYNHYFGEDPEWMINYPNENGTIFLPPDVWDSLLVNYYEAISRMNELEISFN